MHPNILCSLVVCFAVFFSQPLPAVGQEDFAWRFAKADKLLVQITQKRRMQAAVSGTDVDSTVTSIMDVVWTTRNVFGDDADMSMRVTRVRLEHAVAGQETTSVDTNATDGAEGIEKAYLEQLTPLLTASASFDMRPNGEIADWIVYGLEPQIIDPILKRGGVALSDLNKVLVSVLPTFSDDGREKDGTWKTSRKRISQEITAELTREFTVRDASDKEAVNIDVVTTSKIRKRGPDGKKRDFAEVKLTGSAVFDQTHGHCKRATETSQAYQSDGPFAATMNHEIEIAIALQELDPELQKLQGYWRPTSWIQSGKQHVEGLAEHSFEIIGDTLTFFDHGLGAGTVIIKLDATKTPPHIDMVYQFGPGKGETVKGIYKTEGDQFIHCMAQPDADRPQKFKSTAENEYFLSTNRRTHRR